jgi:uncharacterized protein involved in response to NO
VRSNFNAARCIAVFGSDMNANAPHDSGVETRGGADLPSYHGPAFLSYGFRPFFLGAAVFGALAIPAWVAIFAGVTDVGFLHAPRDWHVHEMLFGFLPAVMAGFLLTAIPNWTSRAQFAGIPLLSLFAVWLTGRLLVAVQWPTSLVVAIVDSSFLIALAAVVWRELAAAGSWKQAPIAALISVYAGANILFHVRALHGGATDLPERMALSLIMLLLTVIGGRITPNFTREFLGQEDMTDRTGFFSHLDGLSIMLVVLAAFAWIVHPEGILAGMAFVVAGLVNLVRLWRWRGWSTWREPLVMILHVGYGWLVFSFLAVGAAILELGLQMANTLHVLTTGAVGTMTLAVMTRATLGHTGRSRHAGPTTIFIYMLVNVGALFRIFVPTTDAPAMLTHLMLTMATIGWSGAYGVFALFYGRFLVSPSAE